MKAKPRSAESEPKANEDPSARRPLWVVTGASGFLGNNIVRQLLNEGERVRAAILEDSPPRALEGLDVKRLDAEGFGVEVVQMDVRDPDSVNRAFHAPDSEVWVVHCAGVVSIASSVSPEVHEVNVGGVRNVLSACRKQGVEKLVYVSSVHALPTVEGVGRELDVPSDFDPELLDGEYAQTKAEATALVLQAEDLWRVVVFPTGMIGPNDFADTHLTRLVRDAASGALPVAIEGGYDFVDVRDVAKGVIRAAEVGENGRTYLLSGVYVTAKRMVAAVAKAKGRPAPPALPLWVGHMVAPLVERIASFRGTAPTLTPYALRVLGDPGRFSSKRARDELGFKPRPFRETLRDTFEWVQKRSPSS